MSEEKQAVTIETTVYQPSNKMRFHFGVLLLASWAVPLMARRGVRGGSYYQKRSLEGSTIRTSAFRTNSAERLDDYLHGKNGKGKGKEWYGFEGGNKCKHNHNTASESAPVSSPTFVSEGKSGKGKGRQYGYCDYPPPESDSEGEESEKPEGGSDNNGGSGSNGGNDGNNGSGGENSGGGGSTPESGGIDCDGIADGTASTDYSYASYTIDFSLSISGDVDDTFEVLRNYLQTELGPELAGCDDPQSGTSEEKALVQNVLFNVFQDKSERKNFFFSMSSRSEDEMAQLT